MNFTQIKYLILMALVSSVLFFGYNWHMSEVNKAVTAAVTAIQLDISKKSLKLINAAEAETIALTEKVNQIDLQKKKQMRDADAKYNRLLADFNSFNGLSKRPERTGHSSTSGTSNPTSDSEITRENNFGRLYREDAIFLSDYARTTEELKLELLACYDKYDSVRNTLIEFTKKK